MTDSRPSQSLSKRFWPMILMGAACAVLAVACVWLWQLHLADQAQLILLRNQQQLAELETRNLRQLAEAQRLIDRHLLDDANKRLDELNRGNAKPNEK